MTDVTREDFVAQEAFKRLDAIGNQIGELAPVVWSKMVLLTQAESIAYLGVGGISLVFSIVALIFMGKTYGLWRKSSEYRSYDAPPLAFWVWVFIAAPNAISAGVNLLYPWNWVGAFAPEARLIARLIGAVTQTAA